MLRAIQTAAALAVLLVISPATTIAAHRLLVQGNGKLAVVVQRLEGVDFDAPAFVSDAARRLVRPDGFFRRGVDLGHDRGALLNHDVTVVEHMNVVNRTPRHFPLDIAIGRHDRQPALALQEHTVRTGRCKTHARTNGHCSGKGKA